jgi:P-type Mg2+ transporter
MMLPFLPMVPNASGRTLLYDFSQTAIPADNVDEDYLIVPCRWDISNMLKFMPFIGPISSIFDYVTYFVMTYLFDVSSDPALFQTGGFVKSF